jgi:hypothetical protein
MVKWVNARSKQLSEIKGVRCIYLKVIMIKSDTYHDLPGPITSWSKSLLRCKSKLKVMDVATADKTSLMKEKKDGPSRAMLRSILLSVLHV